VKQARERLRGPRRCGAHRAAPRSEYQFSGLRDLVFPRALRPAECRFDRCGVDRYYDPSTDQWLSVDPDVAKAGQPYAFVGG
jgi:hypothetical protein